MTTRTDIPADEPTIVMTRIYDAPRELVWDASTDPRHIRQWWGGPGFSNPVCEIDLRAGGLWNHVIRFPDGRELPLNFVFIEVEKPARLIWRHQDESAQPAPHFTSTFDDLGGRTRCTLIIRFASIAEREAAVGIGFTGPIEASNDRLAAYFTTMERERRA